MANQENQSGQQDIRWPLLEYPLGVITVILLACMITLTCVDVVARSWFNAPVNGAFELTQLMLAALIFTALPMTTARREHVDVELFSILTGSGAVGIFKFLASAASALVLFVLGWRLWEHASLLARDGAVTNSLGLPFAPIGFIAAISCGVSGVICLAQLAGKFSDKQEADDV